jgi:hypothetical protein
MHITNHYALPGVHLAALIADHHALSDVCYCLRIETHMHLMMRPLAIINNHQRLYAVRRRDAQGFFYVQGEFVA